MTTATSESTTATPPAAPAASAPPAAAVATEATATPASLLAGAATGGTVTPPADGDWMPDKFRVLDADGKLDEPASARKLADSYKALEAHKGVMPTVPATPDDYKIEPPKQADGTPMPADVIEAFTGDPLFKAFAKDAHAQGMTNEQLQFVVDRYLTVAPSLIAENEAISQTEASAELSKLWTDEPTFNAKLTDALKAVAGFAGADPELPGSSARLHAKFGNDPDFLAFAANVASEMKEAGNTPLGSGNLSPDGDVEALQKGEAYWNPKHPDHKRVNAQVQAFYTKKFGGSARR